MVATSELDRCLRKNIVPSFLVLRRPKNRKAARATFATLRSQWAMPTRKLAAKHHGRRVYDTLSAQCSNHIPRRRESFLNVKRAASKAAELDLANYGFEQQTSSSNTTFRAFTGVGPALRAGLITSSQLWRTLAATFNTRQYIHRSRRYIARGAEIQYTPPGKINSFPMMNILAQKMGGARLRQ